VSKTDVITGREGDDQTGQRSRKLMVTGLNGGFIGLEFKDSQSVEPEEMPSDQAGAVEEIERRGDERKDLDWLVVRVMDSITRLDVKILSFKMDLLGGLVLGLESEPSVPEDPKVKEAKDREIKLKELQEQRAQASTGGDFDLVVALTAEIKELEAAMQGKVEDKGKGAGSPQTAAASSQKPTSAEESVKGGLVLDSRFKSMTSTFNKLRISQDFVDGKANLPKTALEVLLAGPSNKELRLFLVNCLIEEVSKYFAGMQAAISSKLEEETEEELSDEEKKERDGLEADVKEWGQALESLMSLDVIKLDNIDKLDAALKTTVSTVKVLKDLNMVEHTLGVTRVALYNRKELEKITTQMGLKVSVESEINSWTAGSRQTGHFETALGNSTLPFTMVYAPLVRAEEAHKNLKAWQDEKRSPPTISVKSGLGPLSLQGA
jgi:hypothetical protein